MKLKENETFRIYKNRTLNEGDKVEVYRNLRTGGFSIRKDGLVVAHSSLFYLRNISVRVEEKKRLQVIKNKSKNVHAYIIGFFTYKTISKNLNREIYYDPYFYNSFIDKDSREKILSAKKVLFRGNKVYYD